MIENERMLYSKEMCDEEAGTSMKGNVKEPAFVQASLPGNLPSIRRLLRSIAERTMKPERAK